MSKLRNVDDLKGRHKLAEPELDGCADAIHLAFPRYQHLPSTCQPSLIPTNGGRVATRVAAGAPQDDAGSPRRENLYP
jgi:hypothetical protein